MKHILSLAGADALGRNVMIAVATILGVLTALIAGLLFWKMNEAGLWGFAGFVLSGSLAICCAGALIVYLTDIRGLR